MTDLLQRVAVYLATKLSFNPGEQVMCYEMPDKPDVCVCVYESPSTLTSPPQIDAVSRRLRISVRAGSNSAANGLAEKCWQAMLNSEPDSVPTGFIKLDEATYVFSDLRSKPLWEKTDQRNRKYFSFETIITTTK